MKSFVQKLSKRKLDARVEALHECANHLDLSWKDLSWTDDKVEQEQGKILADYLRDLGVELDRLNKEKLVKRKISRMNSSDYQNGLADAAALCALAPGNPTRLRRSAEACREAIKMREFLETYYFILELALIAGMETTTLAKLRKILGK